MRLSCAVVFFSRKPKAQRPLPWHGAHVTAPRPPLPAHVAAAQQARWVQQQQAAASGGPECVSMA